MQFPNGRPQLELLLEYMERHKDLALGRVRSKEARALASRLWGVCAELLNKEGPSRNGKEWSKAWTDLKARVRNKLVAVNANNRATGGGPSTAANLTEIEERVANIIGRDIGPLPGVQQDKFIAFEEVEVIEQEIEQIVAGSPELIPNIPLSIQSPRSPSSSVINSHAPSPRHISPLPYSHEGTERSRTGQRQRMPRRGRRILDAAPGQSNRSALADSQRMVLEIERLRAEANLERARTTRVIEESQAEFKLEMVRTLRVIEEARIASSNTITAAIAEISPLDTQSYR